MLSFYEIIEKKKKGLPLEREEIQLWIDGVVQKSIPPEQSAALLMAICLKGMTEQEAATLTLCMASSGAVTDRSSVKGILLDKHSTGGVSDSTTLVLLPALAAAGYYSLKASGKGLGHTGGTVDKLASIPHLPVTLSSEERIRLTLLCGFSVTAASEDLAPADKILYDLRDRTATVDSIPLIAASVMSKKLAGGSDVILLDVKYGSGAFMKTKEQALTLAKMMVSIGENAGRKTACLLSSMNQPLSPYVGCNAEMRAVIGVLRGEGSDLNKVSRELFVRLTELASGRKDGGAQYDALIASGAALQSLRAYVQAAGGDVGVIDAPERLADAPISREICAEASGYVNEINCQSVGMAAAVLGGGRVRAGDSIDHGAGVQYLLRVGDYVNKGDRIATLYTSDENKLAHAEALIKGSFALTEDRPEEQPLFYAFVSKDGITYYTEE